MRATLNLISIRYMRKLLLRSERPKLESCYHLLFLDGSGARGGLSDRHAGWNKEWKKRRREEVQVE